jgi:hypothetical protein
MAGRSIKEGSGGHWNAQHLLEADRLSAKLNVVRPVPLRSPSLVLHRMRQPTPGPPLDDRAGGIPIGKAVEFHDVCAPRDPEREAPDRDVSGHPNVSAGIGLARDHLLVKVRSLHRPDILEPYLLDVDQRRLSLTVDEMLEG